MEREQTICPRCGEQTSGYGFCRSCSSQFESLPAASTDAGAHASDPTSLTAQVLRLEQALAAASQGINDRITAGTSATAVEVDSAAGPTEDRTVDPGTGAVERAELPPSTDHRHSDRAAAPRDVARWEQLLKPDIRTLAERATVAPPTVEEVQLPVPEAPIADPVYVAASLLREAFWFEQASAYKSAAREAGLISTPPHALASTPPPALTSTPPPALASTPPPVLASTPPPALASAPPPVLASTSRPAPAPRSNWIAVSLVALVGLVLLLVSRGKSR